MCSESEGASNDRITGKDGNDGAGVWSDWREDPLLNCFPDSVSARHLGAVALRAKELVTLLT